MSQSIAKKVFAVGSALAMVLSGLAPVAVHAAAHSVGTNVKSSDGTVWMIMSGNCRRAYTSGGAFLSYGFNSWSSVVDANADDLALPVCPEGFIPPQDGKLITSDRGADKGTTYLITEGKKRGFVSAAVFTSLGFSFARGTFGDVSWMNTGSNIDNGTEAHAIGVLVNNGGTVQLVGANGLLGIPDLATFNSWGYSFADVVPANANDKTKTQTGVMSMRQAGQLSPSWTSTPQQPTSGFSATLASDTPAFGTVIAGQAIADLAHFTIWGNGTVTSLSLNRLGVSGDTTLSAVYLYDGNKRITDSATVSSGVVNFNDTAGLFTVSGSKTISVRSNIAASTAGQTLGVQLTSINGVTLSSQPSGNTMTVATSPSNFATVDFNTTTTPSATTIQPQDDYVMWQNTVSIGNYKVWFKSFKLRQIGSVTATDLGNFELFVDGTKIGSTVASLDSQGYLDFQFNPIELQTGSRVIKVVGDIIGGSNRNFSLSLRQASDAMFVDSQYMQPVLATANSSAFSARSSGTQTVDTGTLTFTKRSDSPSGNTVNGGSNVVLAKFDVKAAGEKMKVESLQLRIDEDDTDTAYTLRNGAIYIDGVQVGSTAAIAADNDATQAYTEYTFGSSFIVEPGKSRVMEVRADIYDNDGTNNVGADDTIQLEIVAGSSNVQRMTSLGYGSYPAAATEGGTLTVSTGALTVANNTAYANHTIVAPKQAYKIGSYTIQSNSTEGANITSIVIDFDEVADAADASDDLTNLYLVVGSITAPVKSTVSDTGNTFSTNIVVNAGQSVTLDVYADVASSITDGDGTADTFESSATVSYTTTGGSSTSTSATEVDGQTITGGSGSFATAVDGATPLNRITAANQEVEAARYRLTATSETYYVKEVQVKVSSASVASVVSSVKLYDSANMTTPLGTALMTQSSGAAALFTGLNLQVPANQSKTLVARLVLNQVGTGAGTAQSNAALTLDSVKYADSQGTETTSTTDRAGNELYVYKSIPTITAVNLDNSSAVVNGNAYDLYKFTVTASANGPISLKQFILTTAWSDGGTADTMEVESVKLFEDGVDITSLVTIQDEDGNTVESTSGLLEADEDLTVSWDSSNESTIGAGGSKTYTIRGTPTGFRATGADTVGDSVSFYLAGDTSHNSTSVYLNGTATDTDLWGLHTSAAATGSGALHQFIWSDNSAVGHDGGVNASSYGDWANSYKVLNLDLAGETWSK